MKILNKYYRLWRTGEVLYLETEYGLIIINDESVQFDNFLLRPSRIKIDIYEWLLEFEMGHKIKINLKVDERGWYFDIETNDDFHQIYLEGKYE